MNDKPQCGLLISRGQSIPLQGVRIEARLMSLCSEVTVTQRYVNSESVDVEAVYVFPLEEGAAVSGFRARIGERIIEGRVEERDKAFETYDDAMAEGHGAFLLDQERPNIFTASVGNLRPGQTVEVAITYVAVLGREGEAVRFMLPTTVSPRYVPASTPAEVGEPDGDRINPERWTEVPYGLTLTAHLDMASAIRAVESPSHTIRTEMDGHEAVVSLSSREAALDRDFVLLVETREPHAPSARVAQEEDGKRVAMVTFTPGEYDFGEVHGNEIVFVLDCSGSMGGTSIAEARRALELCVRTLSEEDTFNIIRFGSSFTSMWDRPRPYNQQNLDAASEYIRGSAANMGGTEIYSPLAKIFENAPEPERPRQILLLTDGQVSNEDQVIALCGQNATSSRVFAFGIGAGASEHLVRGVARASRGAAEFIFPGERIESKVLRMFGRVATPALTDVRVDWGGLDVDQAPRSVPPVFGGDSLTLFARVNGGRSKEVTLRAGGRSYPVALDLEKAAKSSPLPTLWARHAIRDLETGRGGRRGSNQSRRAKSDRTRERIVELAVRYGLMSSETSYVAVEERPPGERTTAQAELRKIPVALTTGWGGRSGVRSRAGMGGMHMNSVRPPAAARPMMSMAAMPPPPASPLGGAPPRPGVSSMAAPPAPRAAPAPARRAKGRLRRLFQGRKRDSEARAVDAPAAGADRLFELLLTQRADGSFGLSPVLLAWLGGRADTVQAAVVKHGEAAVATAVVIALLAKEAGDRAAEWTAAVKKAKRWLGKQSQAVDGAALIG